MVPSMSSMGLLRECEERTENSCFALRYTDRCRRLFWIDVVTEADLGTKLNWVGVDHFDTGHAHSHVVIRGKDEAGKYLIIACNLNRAGSANIAAAVADGTPAHPRAIEPVPQLGRPSAIPSNPNSRLGRAKRSPFRQGRDMMDAAYVGIDFFKDRLDVHTPAQGKPLSSFFHQR
jgi:hypothetical protein